MGNIGYVMYSSDCNKSEHWIVKFDGARVPLIGKKIINSWHTGMYGEKKTSEKKLFGDLCPAFLFSYNGLCCSVRLHIVSVKYIPLGFI